ncbi:MAG: GTPase Era [Cryobacterium sp.]|nr:GTPase Era [Cryobacterium sp.]MCO5294210.1 GTPase Era [Homoserinimonas sp.]
MSKSFRSGFATFVGRPNVGKSTLTNALVGEKIAITSDKPQTTRRAIRGIVSRKDGQLVLVDTPGMHRPRTLLGERLNEVVKENLAEVDVICFCIPAKEKLGPGDRFISQQLDLNPGAKLAAIVTKADQASKAEIASQLLAVSRLRDWDLVIPVSARTGDQIELLAGELIKLLPESEPLYPSEMHTEESIESRIAELIREAALHGVTDELPHSIAVTVDDLIERDDQELTEVYANLWVERESQKGIIIGHKGAKLGEIGSLARASIEPLLGRKVFLSLRVKVAKDWQRDPKNLSKLGF